ncbi:50S ribosomal protein L11 methyltransferase [Candidatus Binatia bacterium]|nr:50S ribosomal protein L11 methyltransferase [Candidatus Binatia bacterium]
MARSWAELSVRVSNRHIEAVSNFLVEAGSPGIEVREGSANSEIVGYFAGMPPITALRRLLADLGARLDGIATRRVDEEAWGETWKRHCRPQTIGKRLYVCPSWEVERAPSGRIEIVIDPGMAFGTGDHPTTRACLLLAERAAARAPLRRVLDCGTGSGILAIGAARLGAREVWAVDPDPVARAAATENGEINGIGGRLRVVPSLDPVSGPFDLILANLFADLLAELAPRLRTLLARTGVMVCAGFVSADADRVEQQFAREGLHATQTITEGDWVTLELRRP